MNVAQTVFQNFQKWPDRPALWIGGEFHSYADFHRLASSLAATLDRVSPAGSLVHVAILAQRSFSAYAGILGSLYAGRAYLPLNPRFPDERNLHMLRATQTSAMVVDERGLPNLRRILPGLHGCVILLPEHDAIPTWSADFPEHRFISRRDFLSHSDLAPQTTSAEATVYTVFTSGSTGVPKGVSIRQRNLASFLSNIHDLLAIQCVDRCTQNFDLTFDASVHDLWATWTAGACLYVVPENTALFGVRFVVEHQISVWYSVPATATLLNHHGFLRPRALPSLRLSLFIGEALYPKLARAWQAAAPHSTLYNLYGPTEATVSITSLKLNVDELQGEGAVPIGFPHADHRAAVVNEDLQSVRPGDIGELCLQGPQVASGYLTDSTLTDLKFVQLPGLPSATPWYRTGDLVRATDRFGYEFHGRADRQIKLRGYRVELAEIETAVRRAAGSELVAVIGLKSEKSGGYISTRAFVVGGVATENEILRRCRADMPDYMVPEQICFLQALPLNPNGKTDYRQLEMEGALI